MSETYAPWADDPDPPDDWSDEQLDAFVRGVGELMGLEVKDWDESEHPRDEDGKFTSGGGGDGDGEESSSAGGEHPGHGYSKDAYVKNGKIYTSNVKDAARALYENKPVVLKQASQVSTLIDHLGQVSKSMIKMGAKAPTFNLCNVSVEGSNLFCAETKGIPRVQMPQLDSQQTKDFRKYLEDKGYKVEKGSIRSDHLRATQNELNGAKVAAIAKKLRDDPEVKRIVVSQDDYILDGHHHWAAQVGNALLDGKITKDERTDVFRVNIDIVTLLHEAEAFTGGKGHKDIDKKIESYRLARMRALTALGREWDESEHPRDEDGKFAFGGGGEESGGSEGAASESNSLLDHWDKDFGSKLSAPGDYRMWLQEGTSEKLRADAAAAVLKLGGQAGHEHLAGVQRGGEGSRRVFLEAGAKTHVDLPDSILAELKSGNSSWDLDHYHPRPSPLSHGDITSMNAARGVLSISEHDDEGWSRASVPGRTEGHLVQWDRVPFNKMVSRAMRQYEGTLMVVAVGEQFSSAYEKDKAAGAAFNYLAQHAFNLSLAKQGFIEYEFGQSEKQKVWQQQWSSAFKSFINGADKAIERAVEHGDAIKKVEG